MKLLNTIQKFYPEVIKVVDSKKNLSITVNKKHINSTAARKHKECALAVACKEQYDGAIVGISRAYLIKGATAIRFELPESAKREIVSFDRSGFFDIGEYQLLKPSPSSELGSHSSSGKNRINQVGKQNNLNTSQKELEHC